MVVETRPAKKAWIKETMELRPPCFHTRWRASKVS